MKTIITNIEVQENGYGTATDNRNKQYFYIEESKIDAFVTSCGDIEDEEDMDWIIEITKEMHKVYNKAIKNNNMISYVRFIEKYFDYDNIVNFFF